MQQLGLDSWRCLGAQLRRRRQLLVTRAMEVMAGFGWRQDFGRVNHQEKLTVNRTSCSLFSKYMYNKEKDEETSVVTVNSKVV